MNHYLILKLILKLISILKKLKFFQPQKKQNLKILLLNLKIFSVIYYIKIYN